MNLLTALVLEPILPGPQLLFWLASRRRAQAASLGNYVLEVPEVPAAGQGLLVLGLLVAGIAGLVWYSQRSVPRRLRRNPTPYVTAWEKFLEGERSGASPAELRRLRAAVDEARRKSRERWQDETETTVYEDDR